jgi:aminotransferase
MVTELATQVDTGARFVARRATAWVAAAVASAPRLDLSRDDLARPAARHIVQATIDALDRGATHYTDRTGIAPLRAAVAARFAEQDDLVYDPRGEILIAGGGHEALFVATQMIVGPGDEVLIVEPAPPAFAEGVRLAGGVPIPVPTYAEDRFALKADVVRERITPRTRALIFASPSVPAGGVTTGGDLVDLAKVARAHDLSIVWDETYRDYVFGNSAQANIAALPGMRERTIIVGSLSARHAMSGWRAGYVVGPAALVRPITMMKQALTICSPAPSQWAALAALEGPQGEADAAVREVATRRAAARRALALLGLSGVGAGSPYLFIDVRALGITGRAFADLALREAGMGLMPGDTYGAAGVWHVRLTLDAPAETLREAIGGLMPLVMRLRGELHAGQGEGR